MVLLILNYFILYLFPLRESDRHIGQLFPPFRQPFIHSLQKLLCVQWYYLVFVICFSLKQIVHSFIIHFGTVFVIADIAQQHMHNLYRETGPIIIDIYIYIYMIYFSNPIDYINSLLIF